jgi:Alfin
MDGAANASTTPRTVEEIFKDFRNRRTAIVRALTSGTSHSLFLVAVLQRYLDVCYFVTGASNF